MNLIPYYITNTLVDLKMSINSIICKIYKIIIYNFFFSIYTFITTLKCLLTTNRSLEWKSTN